MKLLKAALLLVGALMASQLYADTSSCTPDFSLCSVFEDGQVLSFNGFLAAAGDVVIDDSSGSVSDVFRIFNDFFDSGGGTGLGGSAFLYSDDEHDLPDPSTYSVNAVFLKEGPSIGGGLTKTVYIGSFGTEFDIYSTETPEPAMVPILSGLGFLAGFVAWRRQRRSLSGV